MHRVHAHSNMPDVTEWGRKHDPQKRTGRTSEHAKNILSLLFIWAALMMNGCTGEPVNKKALDPVPVIVQKAERVSINREISASGNIEGNKTARLGFLVAGKINYIAGEEGMTIGAGKLLAGQDQENYLIAK